MRCRSFLVLATLTVAGGAMAQFTPTDVEGLVSQAEGRAAELKQTLGFEPSKTRGDYAAEAKVLVRGNRERIRQGMPYLSPEYNIDPYSEPGIEQGGALYVAVSLSMPKASLRQLAKDAHRAKAVLVIRGLVGGSFRKTQLALKGIFSEGEAAGVVIDPRVFQQFGVQRVPTFIAATADVEPCDEGFDCQRAQIPFDQVRGNIGMEEALRLLSDKGDAAPAVAREALARMGN